MNKINKEIFLKHLPTIVKKDKIPIIRQKNIKEFKIGKNYFYELLDKDIIKVQHWLNNYFQEHIELNNSVVAFRKRYSYLHLFEPHKQNYYFLRLDIKSFFHNIKVEDIKDVFQSYFENDYIDKKKQQSLIDGFINLVTYRIPKNFENKDFLKTRVLPMGFITSPIISNVIFRKIDLKIQKFCAEKNITYTRYADDMLFSSNMHSKFLHSESFYKEISILLNIMNFQLNHKKTLYATHTLSLNGYTIQHSLEPKSDNEKIINEFRISNKKLFLIIKMIYLINKKNENPEFILKKLFNFEIRKLSCPYPIKNNLVKEKYYYDQLLNKIKGYRSYLLSIVVFHNRYNCCQVNTINKYIEIIIELNEIINIYTNDIEKLVIKIQKQKESN